MIQDSHQGTDLLLTDLARLLRKLMDRRWQRLDLSRAHWSMLATLSSHDGLPRSQMSNPLDIEKSTAGRLIDQVEEQRLDRTTAHCRRPAPVAHCSDRAGAASAGRGRAGGSGCPHRDAARAVTKAATASVREAATREVESAWGAAAASVTASRAVVERRHKLTWVSLPATVSSVCAAPRLPRLRNPK